MDEKQSKLIEVAHCDSRRVSALGIRYLADEVKRLQSAINDIAEIGRKHINCYDRAYKMRAVAREHERK